MTSAEWLTCCDPELMLDFLSVAWKGKQAVWDRKLRLFGAACCRGWSVKIPDPRYLRAVELAERLADGEVGGKSETILEYAELFDENAEALRGLAVAETVLAENFPDQALPELQFLVDNRAIIWVLYIACSKDMSDLLNEVARPAVALSDSGYQATIWRDIFGNPFSPITADPAWLTSTVVALARQMYESRDFSMMPILADALQDAGCDNAEILAHCRSRGPHVRGCFVVDLLLGKE